MGFGSPLPPGEPLILAGNFGELRSNHFHGGLDLKTKGVVGMPLHAVADGYVSRLKVSTYDYGTTLYIDHPNGYTSVYAHLLSFNDDIERFVRSIQKEKESWEIEVYLGKNEINVKKGDVVAISGNSGASRAPHLHFELRETKNQVPVDPLMLGIPVHDEIAPRMYKLLVYPIGDESMARVVYSNGKSISKVSAPAEVVVVGKDNRYRLNYVKEIQGQNKIAFGLEANDFHNGSYNRLGVAIIEVLVNGKTFFSQDIDRVPFTKTRYLNAMIDYEALKQKGKYYYRALLLPGNKLGVYSSAVNNGILQLAPDSIYHVEIHVADRTGNQSVLQFDVRGQDGYHFSESKLGAAGVASIPHDRHSTYETPYIVLDFPKDCFYEPFELQYENTGTSSKGYSDVHLVHHSNTPIHKFYGVAIRTQNIAPKYEGKAVICRSGISEGGVFEDGWMRTRARYFGRFYVDIDTISPMISLYNVYNGKNMARYKSIQVKIGDNLSGIHHYRAYMDGVFVPMQHDYKTGLITWYFDENLGSGEHVLEIVVKDKVGNEARKTVKFNK
jgi:murein DD-endopeptidase MepM/ murein hydrolase activator NlpD